MHDEKENSSFVGGTLTTEDTETTERDSASAGGGFTTKERMEHKEGLGFCGGGY